MPIAVELYLKWHLLCKVGGFKILLKLGVDGLVEKLLAFLSEIDISVKSMSYF